MLSSIMNFFYNSFFSVDFLFIILAILLIVFALLVVLIPNPIHSAFSLILFFLPIAVLYILFQAPFIAVIQILVYAGAIMVLFVFVIMLIDLNPKDFSKKRPRYYHVFSLLILSSFFLWIPWAVKKLMPREVVPKTQVELEAFFESKEEVEEFGSASNIAKIIFGHPHKDVKQANKNTLNSTQIFSFELSSLLIVVAIIGVILLTRGRG